MAGFTAVQVSSLLCCDLVIVRPATCFQCVILLLRTVDSRQGFEQFSC